MERSWWPCARGHHERGHHERVVALQPPWDIWGYTGIYGIYGNQAMCGYTEIYGDIQTGHTGIYGDIRVYGQDIPGYTGMPWDIRGIRRYTEIYGQDR